MKNLLLFAALFLAALSTPLRAQDLNAEMNALGQAWKAAYERGDAKALTTLYADQVSFISAKDGSVTTRTRADIEADFQKEFAEGTRTFDFTPGEAMRQADGSVRITGSFVRTSTNKMGEKTTVKATYDHVVVSVKGQWQLSRMKVTPQE